MVEEVVNKDNSLSQSYQLSYQPSIQPTRTETQTITHTLPGKPQYTSKVISEKNIWNMNYVILAFLIGILAATIEILSMIFLELDLTKLIVLGLSLTVIYAIILFFLLEPKMLREIETTITHPAEQIKQVEVVKTMETPQIQLQKQVEQPKPIQQPQLIQQVIEKPVETRIIERPIIKVVTRTPEKPTCIKIKKKLNIPHYDYIGSTQTHTFHKTSCRLGKLIKRKYKIHSNSMSEFKSRRYKPCEVCILKTKKV